MRKYTLDEDCFKKWTPDMAWLLGLIYSDGCLMIRRSKIGIRGYILDIRSTDEEIILYAKSILNTNRPIYTYLSKLKNRKKCFYLRIPSKIIANDLMAIGLTERKSFTIDFPKVPNNFLKDFIRGYFDGDGCIYLVSKGPQKGEIRLNFTGSKIFISKLIKNLKEKLSLIYNAKIKPNGSVWCAVFCHYNSIKIGNWLYNSTGYFLARKKNKFIFT